MTALDPGYSPSPLTTPSTSTQAGLPNIRLPKGYTLLPQAQSGGSSTLDAAALMKEQNPIVRGLVMGDYDPMLMRRFKPEEQAALLGKAQQYDPGIDMSNYPAKVQAKKAFTSGKSADAIRSINQFLGHVNQLADAETGLNNSNIVPAITNTVGNAVGNWFSGDSQHRQSDYEAVAQAVANEYENMIRGSSISGVKEREANLDALSKNRSPEQVRGWIDGALGVMNSRLGELQDQYKKGTGLQYGFDVLNPKSKSILKRFNVKGEGASSAPSAPPTSEGGTPETQSAPGAATKVRINDPRIDKFMRDNNITDRGQAIRVLQQHGII